MGGAGGLGREHASGRCPRKRRAGSFVQNDVKSAILCTTGNGKVAVRHSTKIQNFVRVWG